MTVGRVEDVGEDGLSILFQQYRDSPRLQSLIRSILAPVQELEDDAFAMLSVYDLETAVGDQLTKIASLLNEPRAGRSDTELRRILRVRIRVLRSEGRTRDLQEVALLWEDLVPGIDTGAVRVRVREWHPHGVVLTMETEDPTDAPADLLRWLRRAKAASIRLVLVYSVGPDHFRLGDDADAPETDSSRGFGSVYDAGAGAPLAGAIVDPRRVVPPPVYYLVTLGGEGLVTDTGLSLVTL